MSSLARVLLASAAALSSGTSMLQRDSRTSLEERPVMKVVRLLQDMKTELETDLEDDKAVHEKLDCWCKDNEQDKTKAIEAGEAKESELESFLGEAAAKMQEMKATRDSTLEEVDKSFDSLNKASALRMKENKEFHGEEMDLTEAIKACDGALVVLGKHNSKPAALSQVRAVAQRLQQAQVLELAKRSQMAPEAPQLATLQSFLLQAQSTGSSFLTGGGKRVPSYDPQSGAVFGILGQMKEEFEADRQKAQAREKQAAEEFAALKTAKEEEIAAGRKLVMKLEGEIADLKVKHAEAFKELEDTQAQLELDRTFLANLKKKCGESAAEFDRRVQDRMEEIVAVSDTIKILNTDAAFDNFDKTVFFQTGQRSSTQEAPLQRQRLREAAGLLQRAGVDLSAPELMLMAGKATLDSFTKVKAAIDKMVAQLTKQQADEVKHRDWCVEETASTERASAAGYDKKDSLEVKIADTEKNIDYLTKEIESTTAAIAEMQEQMKRASGTRESENADYQGTVNDQRMTQIILHKAIGRMKEVYAMLQEQPGAPHIETSGTHTDPGNGPASFRDNAEKNAAGGKVVRLLEQVLEDAKKLENEAHAAEQDSQVSYESFMQDSNKAMAAYNTKVSNMKGAKAKSKEELIMAKGDLKGVMHELEDLHNTLTSLKESCDFIVQNFDARQAARTAEVDALKQAKTILSGA